MEKKGKATSHPQDYKGKGLNLTGKVLVCFVSVEDQDTFDIKIISGQASKEIVDGIHLIEEFPERVNQNNAEAQKYNDDLAKAQEKGFRKDESSREMKTLILDPSMYKVEKVLVYPWAHLSNFLSSEKAAMDVCPMIKSILEKQGIKAYYSPFGWYKAFSLNCLGHEVAEMYRDVPLALLSTEVRAISKIYVMSPDKTLEFFTDNSESRLKVTKIPSKYPKDFQDFIKAEVLTSREAGAEEPPHIRLMQKFELADFDDATDAGNFRWFTKGKIMKDLIQDYLEQRVLEMGGIFVDTPVMYTVKNKKLTAQTARFPAKSYWVLSGNNRFMLRFANDFLLFNMFSQMQLREEQLPIRAYEYEQYAFRREQAGELSGLRRLRAFTMPDMHSLCRDVPQAVEEFKKQLIVTNKILQDFGLQSYMIFRTTEEFWNEQKEWILDIVAQEGQHAILELWPERYYYFILKYERPVLDSTGHSACLATNQIDVESAQEYITQYGETRMKYDIRWHGKDGSEGHPIILHNSPSGAVERVIWALLEASIRNEKTIVPGFKTWISPIQCRVMAISEKEANYAEEIMIRLNQHHIRCDYDDRNEKIGKKVRSAEIEWIPYVIIVGGQELANHTISIRRRRTGDPYKKGEQEKETSDQQNDIPLSEFINMIEKELEGFPRKDLSLPFRRLSTRINFR